MKIFLVSGNLGIIPWYLQIVSQHNHSNIAILKIFGYTGAHLSSAGSPRRRRSQNPHARRRRAVGATRVHDGY